MVTLSKKNSNCLLQFLSRNGKIKLLLPDNMSLDNDI